MGIFILKRKYFADTENKSGSNVGKIALGTGIAAVGAFAAGRRGLLGQNIAKSTNVAWGKLGNKLGNASMVENASKKYYKHGIAGQQATKQGAKDWLTKGRDQFYDKVGASDMMRNKGIQQQENIKRMQQEMRNKPPQQPAQPAK